MTTHEPPRKGVITFLFENSIFLVVGSLAALVWANLDNHYGTHSYHHFVDFGIAELFGGGEHESHAHDQVAHADGHHHGADVHHHGEHDHHHADHGHHHHHHGEGEHDHETSEHAAAAASTHASHGGHGWTLHFVVNDILMALFFALAATEVWEALLPGGSLSNPKRAATPLMATLGGIVGPAGLYVLGALMIGQYETLGRGWAIPCATDIAFSYLVARLIFGKGHPAIAFLLLLAIADDAAGLIILAVFYPSGELQLTWLLGTVGAVGMGLFMRKAHIQSFWWYLLVPGVLSWISFYKAGIHPALGLVPIIPTMPCARKDLGIHANAEHQLADTLNAFHHWWKNPVEVILGLFALCNAGVVLSSVGAGTYLVLLGLIVGKPLGVALFTAIGMWCFKLEMPVGMNMRQIFVIGCIAAVGFTVALFVSTAAFPQPGAVQDSVKMGALASFFAPVFAFAAAWLLGVGRKTETTVVPATGQEVPAV